MGLMANSEEPDTGAVPRRDVHTLAVHEPAVAGTRPPRTGAHRETFDELFVREYEPMVRLAASMLSDSARAEDIVQDAFATVHRKWRHVDNPGGFLRTCVVNGCRSWWRRDAVLRSLMPKVQASTVTEQRDAPDELGDALAALSPRKRAVVALRFYADLPEAEIAATLKMKPGTVKSTLHRALADLRSALADREDLS